MYGGDEIGSLVVEFGSASMRFGFSGEDFPKYIESATIGKRDQQYYPGRQQYYPRDQMEINRLINSTNGHIIDYTELFESFHYGQQILKVQPTDHPLLIVEPSQNSRDERERMALELFEKDEFPALHFARSAVLTCFATGRSSALIVDCGYSHTEVSPVAEGLLLNRNIKSTRFGGQTIDEIANQLFFNKSNNNNNNNSMNNNNNNNNNSSSITTTSSSSSSSNNSIDSSSILYNKPLPQSLLLSRIPLYELRESYKSFLFYDLLRDLRESTCKISEIRLSLLSAKFPSISYELPDKTIFEAGNERFLIPEHYFNPNIDINNETRAIVKKYTNGSNVDSEYHGLSQLVEESLNGCDVDLRKEFSSNLVLTGGQSLYPGFSSRLATEININPSTKVKIVHSSSNPHQLNKYLSWIGGSILSSLGTFHQMWISKQEYQEEGNRILHKKCN